MSQLLADHSSQGSVLFPRCSVTNISFFLLHKEFCACCAFLALEVILLRHTTSAVNEPFKYRKHLMALTELCKEIPALLNLALFYAAWESCLPRHGLYAPHGKIPIPFSEFFYPTLYMSERGWLAPSFRMIFVGARNK